MKLSDAKLINDLIITMLNEKEIAIEDVNATRLLLTTLVLGADKRKVKRFANCTDFDEYWCNLEKCGVFTKDGEVRVDIEKGDMEFLMMVNVAKGLMEAKFEGDTPK